MRELIQGLGRYKFYAKVGKNWIPTAAAWTGGLGIAFLFLTDWKVVTKRIPFIKNKYDHEIPK
ncbi:cytochrome b-c1 complex subunit 10-like [Oculina patagonica]